MPHRLPVEKFEVQGQAIMSVVSAMALIQHRALKILAARGITPLEKDQWYPLDRAPRGLQDHPDGRLVSTR